MSRKKSIAAKVKVRKDAYKRRLMRERAYCSWRVLLLVIIAARRFLRKRHDRDLEKKTRDSCVPSNLCANNFAPCCIEDEGVLFVDTIDARNDLGKANIAKDVVKGLVSRVCRIECERMRQAKRRKRDCSVDAAVNNGTVLKRHRQCIWLRRKYSENAFFRKKRIDHIASEGRAAYQNNVHFRERKKTKAKTREAIKYQSDMPFRRAKREQSKTNFHNRYQTNSVFREMKRDQSKSFNAQKYQTNNGFREMKRDQSKRANAQKYKTDEEFRCEQRNKSSQRSFDKYHSSSEFRNAHKDHVKFKVMDKYKANNAARLKMIEYAKAYYISRNTTTKRRNQRAYDHSRRIVERSKLLRHQKYATKHRETYLNALSKFRRVIIESPDCICVVCRMTFFRNQVIPFRMENFIHAEMSDGTRDRLQHYLNDSIITSQKWICRFCSEKTKKQHIPSRAYENNLQVSEIPPELDKLNALEKHLIALRLPFVKIVNLTSGTISSRVAQKGTKGPVHCVPSDVQDTVTALPRPVNRSMMVRLQLKRRLNYKAIWEEQFVNPNDVRDALAVLMRIHPAYKDIQVVEIDENYLLSDKECTAEETIASAVESMPVNDMEDGNDTKMVEKPDSECLKRLALGDIVDHGGDEDGDVNEDANDIRTKYNAGTDCCTQPCDFNHFPLFDKDPHVIAPAEKNKLCSLLTDGTIESLAFPHLFPDGRGSYNEERDIVLQWKEYCKMRLFSSDPRFGSDSSYIFFLQYLSDLKQVFSSINVAFRKQVPMTARQCLDQTQIEFLLKKDMIYRHLQCVRGSPQFWNQRLKQLFGMSRQLDFNQLFLTFSCADLRWKEFTDAFVRYSKGNVKETYTFAEKTKMLRTCPVVAARMFERRFNTFMHLFIKGGACCLGKVTDWFIRIEMQLRGSPHAHMPVWVENAPKYKGTSTDDTTREAIVEFCDKYITTRFPCPQEDAELHGLIKEVQTHSRNHSKSCLKYRKTLCRFGFPRPVSRRTFICEPIKDGNDDDRQNSKKIKEILVELNIALNALETQRLLTWSDFDNLLIKSNWTYSDYEHGLRIVHTRPIIIHKREPNARWVNQYNEELLRAWNANMDIQFVLDPYACAKYLMSYTTKPEREMSLLLETTHKECREGNMSVREEMKKLTGTFFNHRQVSVQESIYRATKMPLSYCSRGHVFVPAHSGSCRFLKPANVLKQMHPENTDIYMSNLADKYLDRPADAEFDICMAEFASEYEIRSVRNVPKKPRTQIKRLQTLNFAVKKRCGRKAIIRFPYFDRHTDTENYYENLLCLYLPIRSRDDLRRPYELFFRAGEVYDKRVDCMRRVKEIVEENQRKYEAHFRETEEVESLFNQLSTDAKEDDWAAIVAKKGINDIWYKEIEAEDNPDFNRMHNKQRKNTFIDMKQTCSSTDEVRPLLDSMNAEQQEIFYHVRRWCTERLHNPDTEPLRLFITGGAGTGKSHLLRCLHYEATKIFSRKKHLEPDENIDEIHTLITAFTGAAAINVGGVTIHSAFGIGAQQRILSEGLSSDKLNTYRCKLGTLKLLFIDEISLIQADLWGAIHSRLTQIMGIHSNSSVFGNVAIIAIGDFYQCSPVASSSVYTSLLWKDYFECVELTVNERQKSNKCFSQMLNRIRTVMRREQLTEEDRVTLKKCHQRYLNKEYHPEALHLFARNVQVDLHNERMIEKVCTDIRTFYELDRNDKEIRSDGNRSKRKNGSGLRLAKNACVMITRNLCVNDGLANGVVGRVVGFIENEKNDVCRIKIKCVSPRVGRAHRVNCPHCRGQDTVCVARESNSNDRLDFDTETKKNCKQFPLRLSWAMTVHKAQGMTVDEVVLGTKDLFSSGMGYTALSRVRTLEGLFLVDLHFDKLYCHEEVERTMKDMRKMKRDVSVFRDSCEFVNVLFHNIEGLKTNFNALKNHRSTQRATIICLVETWLTENSSSSQVEIDGYRLLHRTRSSSFELDHPLQKQKGGGVAIYAREHISLQESRVNVQLNLEYLRLDVANSDLTIITCYRSPQQKKREFIENVSEVFKRVSLERRILLIGDFNEDSRNGDERMIENTMRALGFKNMYSGISTTNGLTSVDCAFANFTTDAETQADVAETYYSYHNALTVSISVVRTSPPLNKNDCRADNNRMDIDEIPNVCPSGGSLPCVQTNKRKHRWNDSDSKRMLRSRTIAVSTTVKAILEKTQQTSQTCRENDVLTPLQFSEQLAAVRLRMVPMPGDGNCFFRAISHQLYVHQNEHLNIRSAAINYLVNNMTEYVPYLDESYAGPDDYIDRMNRDGTYADHLAVLATAIVIRKNIFVHEKHQTPLLIPGCDVIDHQLHVCYNPHNQHYDSTSSIDSASSFVSLTDMLIT